MSFCIPKEFLIPIKKAFKDGDIKAVDLVNAKTSEDRRAIFEKYIPDKALVKELNQRFERVIASKQKSGLINWFKKHFQESAKDQKNYKTIVEKINTLEKYGLLNDNNSTGFLEDLVAKEFGVAITPEELETISAKTKEIQDLESKVIDNVGTINDQDQQMQYFEKLKDMSDYAASLVPSSSSQVLFSVIGRANMLARVSSGVINVVSNTFWGIQQAAVRKAVKLVESKGKIIGTGFNTKESLDYQKFARKVYRKTGYDITRMYSLSENQKVLQEDMSNTQGKGALKRVARVYEDVIFKWWMGYPDVVSSSLAFGDTANLESSLIAVNEGLDGAAADKRAHEIFTDATRINPQTDEGKLVREKSIANAQYSTFTNSSELAKLSLGMRKAVNDATGDLRLGDNIVPFVKTPANIIYNSIKATGITVPLDVISGVYKTYEDIKNGTLTKGAVKKNFEKLGNTAIAMSIPLTVSLILSALIDDDDYMPPYDPKLTGIANVKNAPYNSIKIGDRYYSLDYFGVLAAPLAGILTARKYNTGLFGYLSSSVSQIFQAPGLKEIGNAVKDIGEAGADPTQVKKLMEKQEQSLIDFARSRLIPGFVSDIARATDEYQRDTSRQGLFAKVKQGIPGLRETLPVKVNALGVKMPEENWLSVFLTGSRSKTNIADDFVSKEIVKLYDSGNAPTLKPISQSSSERIDYLKSKNKFDKFEKDFYKLYREDLKNTIRSTKYKQSSKEEKKNMINNVHSSTLEKTLKAYGLPRNWKKNKK